MVISNQLKQKRRITANETAMWKHFVVVKTFCLMNLILLLKGQGFNPAYFNRLSDAPKLFKQFITKYNKTMKSEYEHQERFKNFVKTLKNINVVNARPNAEKVGPNQYADLSYDEWKKTTINKEPERVRDPELEYVAKINNQPNLRAMFKTI